MTGLAHSSDINALEPQTPTDAATCAKGISGTITNQLSPTPVAGKPLVDKYGHLHSKAVLQNWSAAALKVLDVRWVSSGEPV